MAAPEKVQSATPASDGASADARAKAAGVWAVYALVVLYALCYQLQKPIEPFLVDKLIKTGEAGSGGGEGDAASTYAKFKAFFSVAQSFGSLVFGVVLDRWGVRAGLFINFIACACSYSILAAADSVEMLYLSTVPGVAMAGFLCAQTAMIKLTEPGTERLEALGRLTAAYTIGGITGPYIGGQLGAAGDYFLGARCAAVGSLVAAALVLMLPACVDETSTPPKGKQMPSAKNAEQQQASSWLSRATAVVGLVWIYLFAKVVTSVANSAAATAQPLALKELGAKEATMGTVMSAQFAFGGFANAVLLGPMTAVLSRGTGDTGVVVQNCIGATIAVWLLQAALYSDAVGLLAEHRHLPFIGLALPLASLRYCLGTSITATTSAVVDTKIQGTLMGIEHALFGVAHGLGPLLGVAALEAGSIPGLSVCCAVVYTVVLGVWMAKA